MMQCFHFMVEPAKNITAKLKESRRRARDEKLEPLEVDQLFVVDLARDLSRVCQRSGVLEQVWNQEDVWPVISCKAFILEWAFMLQSKKGGVQQSDGWPEMPQLSEEDLYDEEGLLEAKTVITNWTKDLRAQPEKSVWPGEPVAKVLEDLQSAWRWGRMPTLLTAMELVMWTLLCQSLDKDSIPQQWFIWKQRTNKIGAVRYIPHLIWEWMSDSAAEVTLDLDSANPDLVISGNDKRMRCGFQRGSVANLHQRFDGWWCAVGAEGFSSGRRYWEVEVGERDWRLGVARESALRKGFRSLNTDTGYLTLRLERGTELKALTVPYTPLPAGLIPRRVGVHLDHDHGQLSFYDVDTRAHIYTYNEALGGGEKLYPLFGTVEIVQDLVIRAPVGRSSCLCPASCLWA